MENVLGNGASPKQHGRVLDNGAFPIVQTKTMPHCTNETNAPMYKRNKCPLFKKIHNQYTTAKNAP
jgi:hypothetical protein